MFSDNGHHSDRYIIGLTLGPTFLSSSLYLSIRSLQQRYPGARVGCISPTWFASLFMLGDFLCLSFIGVGGSLAAIYADNPLGVHLMIAGLAIQVLFTAIFCLLLWAVYHKVKGRVTEVKWYYYMLGKCPLNGHDAGH